MKTPRFSRQQLDNARGQSLTELALFLPILVLMLVGFVEIGTYVNDYITAQDASRGAGRYTSPLDPEPTQCNPFNSGVTGKSVSFSSTACDDSEYVNAAKEVRSWGGRHSVCHLPNLHRH